MLPMVKLSIQITIIYDSEGETCDARCGIDWSSAEAIALINQRIKERFDDRVELGYVDLSKPSTNHRALKLNQAIKTENLPLPLLVIDGQVRISGQFDTHLLLDAIDAEIEIKQNKG